MWTDYRSGRSVQHGTAASLLLRFISRSACSTHRNQQYFMWKKARLEDNISMIVSLYKIFAGMWIGLNRLSLLWLRFKPFNSLNAWQFSKMVFQDFYFLGCVAVKTCRSIQTFLRKLMPPSSGYNNSDGVSKFQNFNGSIFWILRL